MNMEKYLTEIKELKDNENSKIEIDKIIKKIKLLSKDLDYDDIKYKKIYNNVEIKYNFEINFLLNLLDVLIHIEHNCDVKNEDYFLRVEIDKRNLNNIIFLDHFPDILKYNNLENKIYKKLIKDFNYISSFYKNIFVNDMYFWKNIFNDSDIYTFTNDEEIISFWNECEYDIIIKNLKMFFNQKGKIKLDDNFLNKYSLDSNLFINYTL
jgi:hypothetical protein